MNFKSRAFPFLSGALGRKTIHGICDLGASAAGTLEYYSRGGTSVQFLDWVNILGEKGTPDITDIEHTPCLELIVCWDLFHFLDDDALHKLNSVISVTLKKKGHMTFLLRRDGVPPQTLTQFSIEPDGIHVVGKTGSIVPGFHRTRRDIERLFSSMTIIQSTILQSGYIEYLAQRN